MRTKALRHRPPRPWLPGSNDFSLALSDPTLHGVIIATPTGAHYSQILQALEAGKAVFTEKPLGETLKQIRECYALAEKVERPLMVGFNRRLTQPFQALQPKWWPALLAGPMLVRITSRDSPLPTLEYLKTSHGIFTIALSTTWTCSDSSREDPVEVYAVGSNFVPEIQAINDLDNVLVTLKYKKWFACHHWTSTVWQRADTISASKPLETKVCCRLKIVVRPQPCSPMRKVSDAQKSNTLSRVVTVRPMWRS